MKVEAKYLRICSCCVYAISFNLRKFRNSVYDNMTVKCRFYPRKSRMIGEAIFCCNFISVFQTVR